MPPLLWEMFEYMKCFKAFFGYCAPDNIRASKTSVHEEPSSCLKSSDGVARPSDDETALDFHPPACPPLEDSPSELRMRYCTYIAQVTSLETPMANEQLQLVGQRLARELFEQALDLSNSRISEFSPDIYWLIQSAAIVSLFADGPHSEVFANYQSHVRYYRGFKFTIARVRAFDQYVSSR